MNISLYNDIIVEPSNNNSVCNVNIEDSGIIFDFFDTIVESHLLKENSLQLFAIRYKQSFIGYVALYNIDKYNKSADIYGVISAKRYFGHLIKAFLSLMEYSFNKLELEKLNFIYREDNYFFDDVCRFLEFIKEGIIRNRLLSNGKQINLNIFGLTAKEYNLFNRKHYKSMFTWDYNYSPENVIFPDISEHMDCRCFTNSLDNPNRALLNDNFMEFCLNREEDIGTCLKYKNAIFPINIFDMRYKYDAFKCQGQTVTVAEENYEDLLTVATAQFGYQESYIDLLYSDGTTETVRFNISDWCENILRDEYIIHYARGCRSLGNNANIIKCDCFIYLKRTPLCKEKKLRAVKFPDNKNIVVFAVGFKN